MKKERNKMDLSDKKKYRVYKTKNTCPYVMVEKRKCSFGGKFCPKAIPNCSIRKHYNALFKKKVNKKTTKKR
jgi:hypothetical protein